MRSRISRACGSGIIVVLALVLATQAAVGAAQGASNASIAKAGVLTSADLPTGWSHKPQDKSGDAQLAKTAKKTSGCSAFVSLYAMTHRQTRALSPQFSDASRNISNEVDVFKSDKAASAALALYSRSSMSSCLQRLFKKLVTADLTKSSKGKIKNVDVTIQPQNIISVGDSSMVYEGKATVTGTDGSTASFGIGNAAVRVGRALDDLAYTTTSADLAPVLQPAIQASVSRLQSALGSSSP